MNSETPLARLLIKIVKQQYGCLDLSNIHELASLDRLRLVLVRCGNGRFLCPAQNVEHFCNIIRRDFDAHQNDCDYVRDVSLPATDAAHRGSYHAHTVEGDYQPAPKSPPATPTRSGFPAHTYSGDFDSPSDADPGL